jgi:DNA-binding response OmpR family regulator
MDRDAAPCGSTKTAQPAVVLTAARNPRNGELLSGLLERQGYRVRAVSDLAEFAACPSSERPDVALLDVSGFGAAIWDACRELSLAGVPVIVFGAKAPALQRVAFTNGARAVLSKPVPVQQVLGMVQALARGIS